MSIRAVRVDRPGGPEVLAIREVAAPTPNADDVLVRTIATSLNPVDISMRTNGRLPFPFTPGWDLAGVVVAGNGSGFDVGDRVIALADPYTTGVGAWSDLLAVRAQALAPAPATAALTEVATLPLAGLTAWQCWTRPPLPETPRVLVIGAAGAVGGYLVQIAVASPRHPATVDGLVSRPAHIRVARNLGAATVTSDPRALPEYAYDVVFDIVGVAASGLDVRRLLRSDGHYVAPNSNLPDVPNRHSVMVQPDARNLRELARLVDAGTLRPRVAGHFPIGEIQAAHRFFEAGGLTGKVVVVF
jgi:NADPH:quinone reductase-like Zn-dependent oxidoreductase